MYLLLLTKFAYGHCIIDAPSKYEKNEKEVTVSVCDKNIDADILKDAIIFWKEQGYKISDNVSCNRKSLNVINFSFSKEKPTNNWAVTQNYVFLNEDDKHYVVKSNVTVYDIPSRYKREVYLHEIGHALGLDHSKEKSDVMYQYHTSYKTKCLE